MSEVDQFPWPRVYRNRIGFIDSFIRTQSFNRLLDIGAGGFSGNVPEAFRPMARYIANTVGADRYLALEMDEAKADRLRTRFGVPNVKTGDLTTFKPELPVDAVFAGLVFVCVRRVDDALDNIRSYLGPGGWLILDHTNLYAWRNILFAIRQGRSRPDQDAHHCFDATWTTWPKKLSQHGFILRETAYFGGMRDPSFIPARFREFIGLKAVVQ